MPRILCYSTAAVLALSGYAASAEDLDLQALRGASGGADRIVTDFVQDAARKPVEVLGFPGIEPGMRVREFYAAGGYYTSILSKAVDTIFDPILDCNTDRFLLKLQKPE